MLDLLGFPIHWSAVVFGLGLGMMMQIVWRWWRRRSQ
jgi:hypothetical protein